MATEPRPPKIVCQGVSRTYPGGVEAVAPLDLTLAPGAVTALVGPSGCGKSTLLRLIAGIEPPTDGRVTIDGAPPAQIQRAGGLAVAFQDPALLPWRGLASNIALARRLAKQRRDPAAVQRMIDLVGLEGFEAARPAELSGGMRQRAAIARAMVTDPGLLLLDEPFGAVDELTRQNLMQDLPPIWEGRATTLLVTHSVAEAVWLADRVVVLSHRPARIAADIAIDLPRPRVPAQFGGPAMLALSRRVSDALAGAPMGMAAQ